MARILLKDMDVNKFIDVAIPCTKDLFSRFGNQVVPDQYYTGDQRVDMNQDKISQIEAYASYAASQGGKPESPDNADE